MHGYCLSESGTFGVCRYCYLKESSKLKTATTTSLPIQVGTAVTKMHRPIRIPSVTADILIPESTPATPVLPKDVINRSLPKDTYTPGPTESASKNDDNNDDFDDEEYFPEADDEEDSIKIHDLVLGDDGILIPPKKDPKDITTDELEEIDKLGSNEKADQLWSLACSLTQQALDDEHPGKTFPTKERYHLYCNYMEQIVLHYADSTHGVELLRYFNSNATKSDWPGYFKTKWNSIRQSCRVDLHKWLKQKNCPLTND